MEYDHYGKLFLKTIVQIPKAGEDKFCGGTCQYLTTYLRKIYSRQILGKDS
jgi:hypothetical protein